MFGHIFLYGCIKYDYVLQLILTIMHWARSNPMKRKI